MIEPWEANGQPVLSSRQELHTDLAHLAAIQLVRFGEESAREALQTRLMTAEHWPEAEARELAGQVLARASSWPQEQLLGHYREAARRRMEDPGAEREMRRAQRLRELEDQQWARAQLAAETREPIVLVPASEVRKRPLLPELVEGVITTPSIGVFFGDTGTYKSFLVLNLLLCVGARSAAFLGHRVNGGGLAVYVMGEGLADAGVRVDAALSANPAFTDDHLHYIEQAFPLSDEAAVDEVIARCRELAERTGQPVLLVVFDSFADFYGAGDNENSSTDMQRLIAGMKRISEALGCVVMANAHTGHGGRDEDGEDRPAQRLRGTSRFKQAWDFELMATGSALRPTKNRYGPLAPPIPYGVRPQGSSLVIAEQSERPAGRQLAAAPEPEWPHPVNVALVDAVTAAVTRTPGMTMTQVAKAVGKRKADVGIALLKAQEIAAVANIGTANSPKYRPGPVMEMAEAAGWLSS